jgi:phage tail sheath protein FI
MYWRLDEAAPPRAVGGALAGLLSKLDRNHGPWRDLDQNDLAFSRELVPAVEPGSDATRQLIREGLNVITAAPGRAARVSGSVTLARNCPTDRKLVRLGVRRLCLMVTNAIERATRWAVFQPNGVQLAGRIHAQLHAYLKQLADAGAFADDDFTIQCDAGLHAQPNHPERGVTILLAFRPVGAPDPVTLTLHQTVSGCRVATTAFAPSHDVSRRQHAG